MEEGKRKWRALRKKLAMWLAAGLTLTAPMALIVLRAHGPLVWVTGPLLLAVGALLYATVYAMVRIYAHTNKRLDWLWAWLCDYRFLTFAAMLGMFLPVFVIMLVIMGELRDLWFVLSALAGGVILCGSCAHALQLVKKDEDMLAYFSSLTR